MSLSDDAREEALDLLESALPWIEELIEEGVAGFERLDLEPLRVAVEQPRSETSPSPAPAAPRATEDADVDFAQSAPAAADAVAVPDFGDSPSLERVREALGDCRRCQLCEGRSNIVFGDGDANADLMFIGEGPGEQEDLRGLPFVGRAGELLTQMIEKGLEIPRPSVYICNIVKCRPPNNRNPLPPEVKACRPFLDGQIDAIRPKVIVTLGKPAASLLLGREVSILRTRGTWHEYRGIPLMPTLHPAYVLRQYTDEVRRNVWEDLKAALAKSREA